MGQNSPFARVVAAVGGGILGLLAAKLLLQYVLGIPGPYFSL